MHYVHRTTAFLSCASGEMHVKLNFSEPFRGITYVDYDKTSPCKFYGDGRRYYELRIPLKGCGTKQVNGKTLGSSNFFADILHSRHPYKYTLLDSN